jgi:hypothetical protein
LNTVSKVQLAPDIMFSKEYPDIFKNTLVYTVHVWPSRRFKVCLPLLNLHARLAQKDSEKV